MKKNILINSTLLGLTATSLLFSACSRPSERPSEMDKKIAANVFAIKDLSEVTVESKAVYTQSGDPAALTKDADPTLKPNKIEGKIADLLKKVKNKDTKKALDEQLKTGAIAIVILNDHIKVLKAVPDTELNGNYDVITLKYLARLKALAKIPEAKAQADVVKELENLKYTSPKAAGEKSGWVELTALKIDKFGVIDNVKNDYDEKKSILTVSDKPFEVSTHLVISDEVSSSTGALLDPPTEDELAAQKASESKAAK